MDEVSYPDKRVARFINDNIIPLRLSGTTKEAADFKVKWTPTLIMLDMDGKLHQRTIGFISPDEIIPALLLGMTKTYFDRNEFDKAISCVDKITTDYPGSASAPEAIFIKGVSIYKNFKDPRGLKECYQILHEKYPDNEWTMRAYPYKLL